RVRRGEGPFGGHAIGGCRLGLDVRFQAVLQPPRVDIAAALLVIVRARPEGAGKSGPGATEPRPVAALRPAFYGGARNNPAEPGRALASPRARSCRHR